MQAGRGKLLHTHFFSMFWQKQPQYAAIATKNNEALFITFSSMVFTKDFVVFKKGTMRKSLETPSTPFQELHLATDSIFSITVV